MSMHPTAKKLSTADNYITFQRTSGRRGGGRTNNGLDSPFTSSDPLCLFSGTVNSFSATPNLCLKCVFLIFFLSLFSPHPTVPDVFINKIQSMCGSSGMCFNEKENKIRKGREEPWSEIDFLLNCVTSSRWILAVEVLIFLYIYPSVGMASIVAHEIDFHVFQRLNLTSSAVMPWQHLAIEAIIFREWNFRISLSPTRRRALLSMSK